MSRKSPKVRKDREAAWLKAETDYICDPDRRPVEFFFAQHLAAVGATLAEARKRARQDRWDDRRRSFWQGVQAAWLRGRQTALLQSRATELTEAQELRSQIYQLIRPRVVDGVLTFPIEPKSLEGMIRTFIQLDDLIDSKREAVLSAVDPLLGQLEAERSNADPKLPLSGQEMREMAHRILRGRRQARLNEAEEIEHDAQAADLEAGSGDGPRRVASED